MTETWTSLLEIKDLGVMYRTNKGGIQALHGISLDIPESRIIAIVGESGCGKSTLGLSIIRLLPEIAFITGGEILLNGQNIVKLNESEMEKFRGTIISMIFQDPMSSLDPTYTVGDQLTEAINVRENRISKKKKLVPHMSTENRENQHNLMSRLLTPQIQSRAHGSRYLTEVLDSLKQVQISDQEVVASKYPHELSGGMAQRVMIAEALLLKPQILIADEPTSALDVTSQAEVLELMRNLRSKIDTSILLITHDLAVAAEIADEIVVMYAGEIVEQASAKDIFRKPLHPYTEGLMKSFPRKYKDEGKLEPIAGDVPSLRNPPTGCRFHPRCEYSFKKCVDEHPKLVEVEPGHKVACFLRY